MPSTFGEFAPPVTTAPPLKCREDYGGDPCPFVATVGDRCAWHDLRSSSRYTPPPERKSRG